MRVMTEVVHGALAGRSATGACILEIYQLLRNVNLVIGLDRNIFIRPALFDHTFEINGDGFSALAGKLDLALVGKVAEAASTNDCLADGVSFIRRNLLWSLSFDGAVDIDFAARLFAYVIDRDDHSRVIVIFLLESA